jgi:hypothetical protein
MTGFAHWNLGGFQFLDQPRKYTEQKSRYIIGHDVANAVSMAFTTYYRLINGKYVEITEREYREGISCPNQK